MSTVIKLLSQLLYPQISVDAENKSVILNKIVALTCILLFYMCILNVHWSLHFDKIIFPVLIASLYINKGNHTEKGRETIMPIVRNKQCRSCLKSDVNMKLSSNVSVFKITYKGLTQLHSFIDFDRDSIESLLEACSKYIDAIVADVPNRIATQNAVPETNISTI